MSNNINSVSISIVGASSILDEVNNSQQKQVRYFVDALSNNDQNSWFVNLMNRLYIKIANLLGLDATNTHLNSYLNNNFDLFRQSYTELTKLAVNNSNSLTLSHIDDLFEWFILDMITNDASVEELVRDQIRDKCILYLSTPDDYEKILDHTNDAFKRTLRNNTNHSNNRKVEPHGIFDAELTTEEQLNHFIAALLHDKELCTPFLLELENGTLSSAQNLKLNTCDATDYYTIPYIKSGNNKYLYGFEQLYLPKSPPDSLRSCKTFSRHIDLLNSTLTKYLTLAINQYKKANKNGENITNNFKIDDSIVEFYKGITEAMVKFSDDNEVRVKHLDSCTAVRDLLLEFKKLNNNYTEIQGILKDLKNNNELININQINTVDDLNKSLELIMKIDEIKVKLKVLGYELQLSENNYTKVIDLIKDYETNNYNSISQNVQLLSDVIFDKLKQVCSNVSINDDLCDDNGDSQSSHSGSTNDTNNIENPQESDDIKFIRLKNKRILLNIDQVEFKKLGFVSVSEHYRYMNFTCNSDLDIKQDIEKLNPIMQVIDNSCQEKCDYDKYVALLNDNNTLIKWDQLKEIYDFHKNLNYGQNKDSYDHLTRLLKDAFCKLLTKYLEADEYDKIKSFYNKTDEKFDLCENPLILKLTKELYNDLCSIDQDFSQIVSNAIDELINNMSNDIKIDILKNVLLNDNIEQFSDKHLLMFQSLLYDLDRKNLILNFFNNNKLMVSNEVVMKKLCSVISSITNANDKIEIVFKLLESLGIYNNKNQSLNYKCFMQVPLDVILKLNLQDLIVAVNNGVMNQVDVNAIKSNKESTLSVEFESKNLNLTYLPRDCKMSIRQFIDCNLIDSLCDSIFVGRLFNKLLSPDAVLETTDNKRYTINDIINCNMPLSAILELINASSVSSSNFIRAISDYCNDPKNSNMISRLENVLNNDKHLTIDKDLLLTIKTAVNNGFNLITKVIPAKNQHLKKVDYITEKNLMIFDGPFADILLDQTNISIAFEFMNQDLTTRVKLQLNSTNKLTKELNESLIFFVEMNINKILKIEDLSQDTASVQKLRMAFYLLRLASNDEKLAQSLKTFFCDKNIDFELSSYIAFIIDHYKQESSKLHDYMKSVANQLLCTDPNELAKTKDNIVLAMTALASNINAKGDNDRYLQVFCALFNKQLNKTLKPNDIKTKDKKEIQAVISMLQALSVVCRAEA